MPSTEIREPPPEPDEPPELWGSSERRVSQLERLLEEARARTRHRMARQRMEREAQRLLRRAGTDPAADINIAHPDGTVSRWRYDLPRDLYVNIVTGAAVTREALRDDVRGARRRVTNPPNRVAPARSRRYARPVTDQEEAGMRECTRCHRMRDTDEFRWMPGSGRYHPWCRECERASRRERNAERAASGEPRRVRRAAERGRRFGVEMELTGPDARTIIEALVAAGIPMDSRNVVGLCENGYHASSSTRTWELKHDSSVRGAGLELVSPILRGSAGFRQLEKVCRTLREIGATVDRSCGLHVHHDMRGHDAAAIRAQAMAYVERQAAIERLVAPSRRGYYYAERWGTYSIDMLRDWTGGSNGANLRSIAYVGPRGSLNLQSYARHGTFEVRLHGGTINFRKIAAWVRFSQALFAWALDNLDAGGTLPLHTSDPEGMLTALVGRTTARATEVGFSAADAAVLLRFERVGQTRREVEAAIAEAQELLEEVAV